MFFPRKLDGLEFRWSCIGGRAHRIARARCSFCSHRWNAVGWSVSRLLMLRQYVLSLLLCPCAAYSLLRAPQPGPVAPGFGCIAVPLERLIAPGQRCTLHHYDTSSLQVLRHAQSQCNGTYGQVVIDAEAAAERKFRLMPTGTKLKVLSSRPSTHTDKFGGSSTSVLVDVRPGGSNSLQMSSSSQSFVAMTARAPPLDQ